MIPNIQLQNEIMKIDINGIENLMKEEKNGINIENLMKEKKKGINDIEIMIMKEKKKGINDIKNMIMKVKEKEINVTKNTKMKKKVSKINILENMIIIEIAEVNETKTLTMKKNTHLMMKDMTKKHYLKNIQIIMTKLKNIKKVLKPL